MTALAHKVESSQRDSAESIMEGLIKAFGTELVVVALHNTFAHGKAFDLANEEQLSETKLEEILCKLRETSYIIRDSQS